MIIKSERFLSAGVGNLAAYLAAPGTNEQVDVIEGDVADIELFGRISKLWRRPYGARHFMLCPEEPITSDQLEDLLDKIIEAYGGGENIRESLVVVRHQKPRASGLPSVHYHVATAEVDTGLGRVMRPPDYPTNELLSRIFELEHGHRPVPGRWNRTALKRLRKQRPDLDLHPFIDAVSAAAELEGVTWEEYRPRQAFGKGRQQRLQRKLRDRHRAKARALERRLISDGWSPTQARQESDRHLQSRHVDMLPGIRHMVRGYAAGAENMEDFGAKIREAGFTTKPAASGNGWTLAVTLPAMGRFPEELVDVGTLHSLAAVEAAELDAALRAAHAADLGA